jgi:hypothetical protein
MSVVDVHAVERYVDAARRRARGVNRLPGGQADRVHPRMFSKTALVQGTIHELEHTRSIALAMEIAMDHLVEDESYYTKLARMEAKAPRARLSRPSPGRKIARLMRGSARAWGER